MKPYLSILAAAAMSTIGAGAATLNITSSSPDSVLWVANGSQSVFTTLTLSDPENIFPTDTFTLQLYPVDNSYQPQHPFADITLTSGGMSFINAFYREGTTMDFSAVAPYNYTSVLRFISQNVLQKGAVNGTDNYVGLKILDSNSQPHYGWLQFELNQFSDGTTAIDFIRGEVESSLNTSMTIGAVPEPSATLLGGLGVLALLRRRRA